MPKIMGQIKHGIGCRFEMGGILVATIFFGIYGYKETIEFYCLFIGFMH